MRTSIAEVRERVDLGRAYGVGMVKLYLNEIEALLKAAEIVRKLSSDWDDVTWAEVDATAVALNETFTDF